MPCKPDGNQCKEETEKGSQSQMDTSWKWTAAISITKSGDEFSIKLILRTNKNLCLPDIVATTGKTNKESFLSSLVYLCSDFQKPVCHIKSQRRLVIETRTSKVNFQHFLIISSFSCLSPRNYGAWPVGFISWFTSLLAVWPGQVTHSLCLGFLVCKTGIITSVSYCEA